MKTNYPQTVITELPSIENSKKSNESSVLILAFTCIIMIITCVCLAHARFSEYDKNHYYIYITFNLVDRAGSGGSGGSVTGMRLPGMLRNFGRTFTQIPMNFKYEKVRIVGLGNIYYGEVVHKLEDWGDLADCELVQRGYLLALYGMLINWGTIASVVLLGIGALLTILRFECKSNKCWRSITHCCVLYIFVIKLVTHLCTVAICFCGVFNVDSYQPGTLLWLDVGVFFVCIVLMLLIKHSKF